MYKILLSMLLSLAPVGVIAGDADSSPPAPSTGEQAQAPGNQADMTTRSISALLAEMNRNTEHTNALLEQIAADSCSRQLQQNTLELVTSMTRNIQIMTDIMVRMGYNIEQMSRAPKAMNSFPFMP